MIDPEHDENLTDEYYDCTGKKRIFKLTFYNGGDFLRAIECRNNGEPALRFILSVKSDEALALAEMRKNIRRHLSQKDVVRDQKGRLHILHDCIRAQITTHKDESTPSLLLDDMEISWEEFGQLLTSYSGWGLRIKICESGEE